MMLKQEYLSKHIDNIWNLKRAAKIEIKKRLFQHYTSTGDMS